MEGCSEAKSSSKMKKFRQKLFQSIQADWTKEKEKVAKYFLEETSKNIFFKPTVSVNKGKIAFLGKI